MTTARPARLILLSPAITNGKRAEFLFKEPATFPLAQQLRAEGVPLGEVFAFVSALYFRGKLTYARHIAGPRDVIRIITSNRGLVDPLHPVTIDDLRELAQGSIDHERPEYRDPILRDIDTLLPQLGPDAHAILLGSIATDKYTGVFSTHFGERLLFPSAFVGRGDMSRGGLMLRCAREGEELDYISVISSIRRGRRPERLS